MKRAFRLRLPEACGPLWCLVKITRMILSFCLVLFAFTVSEVHSQEVQGEKMIGAGYFLQSSGFGFRIDFTYSLSPRLFVETAAGFHRQEYKGVRIERIPLRFGAKFRLLDFFDGKLVFFLGAAAVVKKQTISGIIPSRDPQRLIYGAGPVGEMALNLGKGTSLNFRLEQNIILNEKVRRQDDSTEILMIFYCGMVVRKSF